MWRNYSSKGKHERHEIYFIYKRQHVYGNEHDVYTHLCNLYPSKNTIVTTLLVSCLLSLSLWFSFILHHSTFPTFLSHTYLTTHILLPYHHIHICSSILPSCISIFTKPLNLLSFSLPSLSVCFPSSFFLFSLFSLYFFHFYFSQDWQDLLADELPFLLLNLLPLLLRPNLTTKNIRNL